MTTINRSASALAAAYIAAKSAKGKKTIRDEVAARAQTSKRLRWGRLLEAIDSGDGLRVAAYAATGEAKSQAWAAVKAADASAPKAKAPAKRKPAAAKPKAQADDLAKLAQALVDLPDEAALAAFFQQVITARAK
jgi:hypothetical protein